MTELSATEQDTHKLIRELRDRPLLTSDEIAQLSLTDRQARADYLRRATFDPALQPLSTEQKEELRNHQEALARGLPIDTHEGLTARKHFLALLPSENANEREDFSRACMSELHDFRAHLAEVIPDILPARLEAVDHEIAYFQRELKPAAEPVESAESPITLDGEEAEGSA